MRKALDLFIGLDFNLIFMFIKLSELFILKNNNKRKKEMKMKECAADEGCDQFAIISTVNVTVTLHNF
jgi:hypothetical protein